MQRALLILASAVGVVARAAPQAQDASIDATALASRVTCNGKQYTYNNLAGYGFIPSDARDQFGDTLGGWGSAISFDKSTWKKVDGVWQGDFYATPDRGWNTEGTLNYQGRVHKFHLTLTPQPKATPDNPSQPNINITYLRSTALRGPGGRPNTGLDADFTGGKTVAGFPLLPQATYPGDGFGGDGPGGQRISVDNEGLVRMPDGTYWLSEEYGPYIWQYNANGKAIKAIRPPDAFVPMRNGSVSFNGDNPPLYDPSQMVNPEDPDSGRDNNSGLEGLTISPDGKMLYSLLQSALVQDGGTSSSKRRYTRLVAYDISTATPALVGEYVVPLPFYVRASDGKTRAAAQSEIHYISPTQFFVLARDSSVGRGQDDPTSVYRHADIFDISTATNIANGDFDCATCAVAPGGVLNTTVTPATYCSFLDYNLNSELNKFGLHNGGDQDAGLLNEKWESLALLPISTNQYFLFSVSDNDFITQNGYMNKGAFQYADSSGFNLDNQMLAFRVTLPAGSTPA